VVLDILYFLNYLLILELLVYLDYPEVLGILVVLGDRFLLEDLEVL